jgi:hypothetical protein
MRRSALLLAATGALALAGLIAIAALAPERSGDAAMTVSPQTPIHYRYIPNFIPESPFKRDMNGRFRDEIQDLRRQVMDMHRTGHEPICSTQILGEARDLMNYTNDAAAVRARLNDLRASLAEPDQDYAYEQSAEDGSWGGCYKAWYLRLDASVDPLKELVETGRQPTYPLRFFEPVNTPEKMRAYLERLLISDVKATGIDNRKELNYAITSLAQLLFKPKVAALLPAGTPTAELAATLQDFLDNRAQNPDTGFWGAWYLIDGELKKTNDLSITFHAISYRSDDPPHMRELADTLFAMRTSRYPYGWRDQGKQNNHHVYDVARLLRRTWPYMTPDQQARATAELTIMVARSLSVSIRPDGSFDDEPYSSPAEAYYFGVSFLDEVGFFRPSRRFWTPLEVSDSESLRGVLLQHLQQMDQRNAMVSAALRKLTATD